MPAGCEPGCSPRSFVGRGTRSTWWSSTHSHQRKTLLFDADRDVEVASGFRLKLLHAGGYRRNRSFARLLHHSRLAAKFRRLAPSLSKPDVIVSAFPTIGLAYEAVAFAKRRDIPVIIDIRDPWPDILLEFTPRALRVPARVALAPAGAQGARELRRFRQPRRVLTGLPGLGP